MRTRAARPFLPAATMCLMIATLMTVLAAAPVWAQDGVIAGKITDPEGNPVANAEVFVISVERAAERVFRTNQDGEYLGRGLRPEFYLIRIVAEGFAVSENQIKINLGMNTVDVTVFPPVVESNVDYDAINQQYESSFKAYQERDWPLAETNVTALLAAMEGVAGEEADIMRASAYEILGASKLEQNKIDEALEAYQALLALNPDSLAGHTWAAQAYTKKGDYEGAVPHLRRAAELAPDDAAVQYNAGAVLLQTGAVEEGIAAMERSVELRPDFPVAKKNLAYAYLRVQRYEDSIKLLENYLELSPDAADRAEIEGMIAALKAQIGG